MKNYPIQQVLHRISIQVHKSKLRVVRKRVAALLVDEAPQPRCTQAIAIPNDPRDCEIFRLPSWCGAIEAKVPCFAADVMISPSGCDVLRVGSNDALEPLDDEVGIW